MQLPPDAKNGDLFRAPPADIGPLTPERMDTLALRMKRFDGLPRSNPRRKDFLLETIAMLDDLYPATLSNDRNYRPLRPQVEAFVLAQRALRENAPATERHGSRPEFRTELKGLVANLENAGKHMLWQASHDALQEANARDMSNEYAPVYAFPHISKLALRPPKLNDNSPQMLIEAYKHDRNDILAANPSRKDDPRLRSCHMLDVLHMARWGQAAAMLAEQLKHYEISLSDPKVHKEGSWVDSVTPRPDVPAWVKSG